MEQPEEAWILTDGHAGNVRQARALADALSLRCRDWVVGTRAPWRWFAPRALPGASRAFATELRLALTSPPSLVIGCGRQGALATRLARRHGASAVQILDPRVPTRHWDLVIAPEHDERRGGNVISLRGSLHPVDDDWLESGRRQFAAFADLPLPRIGLLLGGPGRHAAFDERTMRGWLDEIVQRVEAKRGSLLATTSRRTPAWVRDHLLACGSHLPGCVWAGPGQGPNPYAGILGWADALVCTADSVNMLSEAAATSLPVGAVGVARVRGGPRRFVDRLIAEGRVHDGIDVPLAGRKTPLRETARVAAAVRERLQLPSRDNRAALVAG